MHHGRYSIPSIYYFMTPVFIVLDYLFGINVRVTVLDAMPRYKYLYYGFCLFCGIGMYVLPRCTPVVALFESTLNILLVVLTVFLPYIKMVTSSSPGPSPPSPFTAVCAPSGSRERV